VKALVKNGTVVTALDTIQADVLIEDGVISAIGRGLSVESVDRVYDAAGKLVLPGGVDVHTHMEMPFGGTVSADDFESGTTAAAWGGTTTIVDFAIQPDGTSLPATLEQWWKKAEGKAVVDYAFHMVIREWSDQIPADMDQLVKREGVTSFKIFMAYPGALMLDDASLFKAFQQTATNGGLICVHAENGGAIDVLVKQALAAGNTGPKYHMLTRPSTAEAEATHRAIRLAEMAGAPVYFVHLSCADALEMVRAARDRSLPVHAETCPHYLFLSKEEYDRPGFEGSKYVMTPPLRAKSDQTALWQGLAGNDLQVISTDHCPFCFKGQKELGKDDFSLIPNGAPGVESRLSMIYDGGVRGGRISLNRFVDLVSTAPARMMGLYPRKGTIAIGSDADLVIFDPDATLTLSAETHHSAIDYNLYEGTEVTGIPVTVLVRGEPVLVDRQFVGKAGGGQFLKRSLYQSL
jgi:dihydropyrimidinase